jgi:hypothetical protein
MGDFAKFGNFRVCMTEMLLWNVRLANRRERSAVLNLSAFSGRAKVNNRLKMRRMLFQPRQSYA